MVRKKGHQRNAEMMSFWLIALKASSTLVPSLALVS